MTVRTQHDEVVRREFTRQAADYAAATAISDGGRIGRLIETVRPSSDARVLEIATGPGYVAMGFAAVCREVVGVDVTDAMLAIARQTAADRGLTNIRFEAGNAAALTFEDGALDVVVCRYAFHHFEQPQQVLAEMVRVCRTGGTVAVEDAIVSEHPERAGYQNRFENLCDPSHTRALPLTALIGCFAAGGLEVERVTTSHLTLAVEQWMAVAKTPPDRAVEVRQLIEQDERDDLSGTQPFRRGGDLYFRSRIATVVGRKLG
ncbi:MAG: class I SAM-dependent methyltransferase [Dehalococcoidia bacterium]